MRELLKGCGYFRNPAAVSEKALRQFFIAHPEEINAWVALSQDQRGTPAFFIVASDETHHWSVGMLDSHGRHGHSHGFASGAEACAYFVKHWLASMVSREEAASAGRKNAL